MGRKTSRRKSGPRRLFLLQQILPMRPYILGLMADLRRNRVRQLRLRRLLKQYSQRNAEAYEQRRQRHAAQAELEDLDVESAGLMRDFRKLGVRVGNVLRGEMLFSCLVDNRDAYFIWYDGERRPSHWRFRGERQMHTIPQRWFTLFGAEVERTGIEDAI